MKKTALFITALVLGILAVAFWQFWGQRFVITLTEGQIIEKLNQKFPFEKNYFFFINIRFTNPKLSLEEGSDRIRFGCDVETNFKVGINSEPMSGPLAGTSLLSGQLRYDSSEGAFFLDSPEVEKLEIAGLPKKYSEKVNSAASHLAADYLSRTPIYRLSNLDVKQATARLILKKVIVSDGKLVITLGVGG